jgi:hypothetical protein
LGQFKTARERYEYRSKNCLYCVHYEDCPVWVLHQQNGKNQEEQDECDRAIPWDGQQNGRCVEFRDVG